MGGEEHNLDEFVDFWDELQRAHGAKAAAARSSKSQQRSRANKGNAAASGATSVAGVRLLKRPSEGEATQS